MVFRQKLVEAGDLPFYKAIERQLKGMESVLDVGCGSNSPLSRVKKNFYSFGIDVFDPSIKKSRKAKIHNDYRLGDILKLGSFFKPKSFDAVVALDVVEHFKKKDALNLIKSMEIIARKKIIIFTPYGFTQQHPYDGNPYQVHKSGWVIEDFKIRGYNVYGMRGFRFIRGEYATIKYKPWLFWGTLSVASQIFTYYIPRLAYQLLAIKEIKR